MATATPLTKLKKCDLIRLVRSLTKTKKERMFKRNGGKAFEIAACNINRITKEQLLSKVYRLQEERKPKAKAKTPSKPTLKPRPKDDTWPIPIVKTDSKGIIKLPGVGNWPAIEFGKIKPGVIIMFGNYSKAQVLAIRKKGKQSVEYTVISGADQPYAGTKYTRTARAKSTIGLAQESNYKTNLEISDDLKKKREIQRDKAIAKMRHKPGVKMEERRTERMYFTSGKVSPETKRPQWAVASFLVTDKKDPNYKMWESVLLYDFSMDGPTTKRISPDGKKFLPKGLQQTTTKAVHKRADSVIKWANEVLYNKDKPTSEYYQKRADSIRAKRSTPPSIRKELKYLSDKQVELSGVRKEGIEVSNRIENTNFSPDRKEQEAIVLSLKELRNKAQDALKDARKSMSVSYYRRINKEKIRELKPKQKSRRAKELVNKFFSELTKQEKLAKKRYANS